MKKPRIFENITFHHIVGGGQSIGELPDGKKVFAWGVLPGETATIQQTKRKSRYVEGVAIDITCSSPERTTPRDPHSYLSTSPWQILDPAYESHYKAALIEEAFELHNIVLPHPIDVYSDGIMYEYRNKIEFSWYWNAETSQLDLAFFRRGTKGKIPVEYTSLAKPEISAAALKVRDVLRNRQCEARPLKTLLMRCNQAGEVVAQLYVKEEDFATFSETELAKTTLQGFELIYSDPKSPANIITTRLQQWGLPNLSDTILDTPFTYATEGFFQINIPVYEEALRDMQRWTQEKGNTHKPVIDLYAGVGSIGLTIGGDTVTLIEINAHAVHEMHRNITALNRNATALLAPSEKALEYISGEATIIVDPPRAGLHNDVIAKLLETTPSRIIYLSCNPVTQARDIAKLSQRYGVRAHHGYNFFPRTPHIEHLAVLDKI